MDQANPFETPRTFALHRAEYLVGFTISVGLIIANFTDVRWLPFAALFLYIDLIGYIPGAFAFRRANGRPIHKTYYVLYNTTHSLISAGAVAALWCLFAGPEWALLALPFHLFGDRALFGNFMKSFALPFEPVRQQGYLRLVSDLGLKAPTPLKHAHDPVPVGHIPASRIPVGLTADGAAGLQTAAHHD